MAIGKLGAPRLHQDEVIRRFREKHGDRYDYSKFVYVTLRTKGEIVCRSHGSFWQTYGNHYFKTSHCPKCAHEKSTQKQRETQRPPPNKLNLDVALSRMRAAHGDRYDYSGFEFINTVTPGKIRCSKHGDFWMSLNSHVKSKDGCPACANDRLHTERVLSFDEVVRRAREVHGHAYEYLSNGYVNTYTPLMIVCSKHGAFRQLYDTHVKQMSGCPRCYGSFKRTTDEFVAAAKEVHGERYDYSETEYVNNSTSVKIVCSTHGSFWQKPLKHINTSQGCPRCAVNVSKMERKWLAAIGVPDDDSHRQVRIPGSQMRADGMIERTVYEFFDTYWHGDPRKYAPDSVNVKNGHRMGSLYLDTLEKQRRIRELGYELKFVWELDYRAGLLFSEKNPHE